MLQQLQRFHASILSSLDELDILTAKTQPPMDRLPAVRLTLTRASRARTVLLERAYNDLVARAPASQKAALKTLRAEGMETLVSSARHIGTWTLCEVTHRWPDYCVASNTMRANMRARIKKEAALVYPLLAEIPAGRFVA